MPYDYGSQKNKENKHNLETLELYSTSQRASPHFYIFKNELSSLFS